MSIPRPNKVICTIICIILFAALAIPSLNHQKGDDKSVYSHPSDTLRCAIMLKSSIHSRNSRNLGFNYELLKEFGESNHSYVEIKHPADAESCWDELIAGNWDIIVFNLNDSIPAGFTDLTNQSVDITERDIWIVKEDARSLLNAINFWYNGFKGSTKYRRLSERYFQNYNVDKLMGEDTTVRAISPYDDIIKKYSRQIGIDWRLFAAMIYQESKFSIGATAKSAKGLTQIKESTAARYGVYNILDPESNIKAGALHLKHLIRTFNNEGMDSLNVIKFALAAYNAGEARIDTLRTRAMEAGYDAQEWNEILEFVGRTEGPTATYIHDILERYENYQMIIE